MNGQEVITLLRPTHWAKNFFVFIPLFFNGELFDGGKLAGAVVAFLAFSFAASGIYCLNDICDAEADRQHPVKCRRPVASGALTKTEAAAWMTVLIAAAFLLSALMLPGAEAVGIIVLYVLLNIAYCFGLKRVAIVDVFVIALGFVFRIMAGAFATGAPLSHWVVMIAFLLALFLALAKRRDDVLIFEKTGVAMRRNTERLNRTFLDAALVIVATVLMVSYIMYTVSDSVIRRLGTDYLYVTSLFVLLGILRYLQRTLVDNESGSPTRILLHDRFVQFAIAGWLLVFGIIIYS